MPELTALPGVIVPGTPFRRDQPVVFRGDRMLYLGRLFCASGALEILWHGSGRCFAHIEEVKDE